MEEFSQLNIAKYKYEITNLKVKVANNNIKKNEFKKHVISFIKIFLIFIVFLAFFGFVIFKFICKKLETEVDKNITSIPLKIDFEEKKQIHNITNNFENIENTTNINKINIENKTNIENTTNIENKKNIENKTNIENTTNAENKTNIKNKANIFKELDNNNQEDNNRCNELDPINMFGKRLKEKKIICENDSSNHICYQNNDGTFVVINGVICSMENIVLDPSKWKDGDMFTKGQLINQTEAVHYYQKDFLI